MFFLIQTNIKYVDAWIVRLKKVPLKTDKKRVSTNGLKEKENTLMQVIKIKAIQ